MLQESYMVKVEGGIYTMGDKSGGNDEIEYEVILTSYFVRLKDLKVLFNQNY